MESSSFESNLSRGFFHDLHSFKDFVGMVVVCAPDQFIPEDWRPADEQLNLNSAFVALRYGLQLTTREKGKSALLDRCRQLVEESFAAYKAGRDREGQRILEEMESLINQLPSE
jgi:hypothetical protein